MLNITVHLAKNDEGPSNGIIIFMISIMIMIRKIICDNAEHHSAPCEERRGAKQWNIGLKQAGTHVSQGGKEEDNGDNDY